MHESVHTTDLDVEHVAEQQSGRLVARQHTQASQAHNHSLPLRLHTPPLPAQHPTKLGRNIEQRSYELAPANQEGCRAPCPSISPQEA
jgi:hypothetical protein